MRSLLWLTLSLGLFSASPLYAAFHGRVAQDRVELKEDPEAGALTLKVLRKGTPLLVADQTRRGYYYVRVEKKQGWLPLNAVERIDPAPRPSPAASATAPGVGVESGFPSP